MCVCVRASLRGSVLLCVKSDYRASDSSYLLTLSFDMFPSFPRLRGFGVLRHRIMGEYRRVNKCERVFGGVGK